MKKILFFLFVLNFIFTPSLYASSKKEDIISKININSANAKELTRLSGIGKKTAESIIKFRDTNGPFKSVNDLLKIKGIGQKTLNRMKNFITIDPKDTIIIIKLQKLTYYDLLNLKVKSKDAKKVAEYINICKKEGKKILKEDLKSRFSSIYKKIFRYLN